MLRLQIEPPGDIDAPRRLQDDERGLTFTYLGTLERGHVDTFELIWAGRHVPIAVRHERRTRADGTDYLLYDEPQVDGMAAAKRLFSGEPAELSRQESSDATRLASECILAFGQDYDGLTARDGAFEIQTSDGRRTLRSYGY